MKKETLRTILIIAVILFAAVLLLRIIGGVVGLLGSALNALLGVAVVIGLVIIVIWMFAYAKKNR